MSAAIDQKAYLQKYLGKPSLEKKKKKKKAPKGAGFKIIDDDVDLSKLRPLDGDELDIMDQGEDAPQIVGIIDERPEEVKKLEQFKTTSKWRVVNQDDGFNSKLEIEEIKKDVKEVEKENEIIFGKMYSDSEDDKKNDSDISPARKPKESKKSKDNSLQNLQNNSDSDCSPPRNHKKSRHSDSDVSTSNETSDDNFKRKDKTNIDTTRTKRKNKETKSSKSQKNYDSDLSPPRKLSKSDTKPKDKIRKSRWGDFSKEKQEYLEQSKRHRSESPDVSPKTVKRSTSGKSHKNKDYDSDMSPPRKRKQSPEKDKYQQNTYYDKHRDTSSNPKTSSYRKDNRHQSNFDEYSKSYTKSSKRKYDNSDSDLSPPRKSNNKSKDSRKTVNFKNDSHRRRKSNDSDLSPPRRNDARNIRSSDSPPPTNKKMAKTLEGKLAGLQDAEQLKNENAAFRRREEEAFKKMSDEMSGRNAKAVSRKSKRETSEDRQQQRDKAERQKLLDEKYKKWSKGVKQVEAQEERIKEFLHESAKPLARYKDDRDLESKLKDVERAGDPMLQYMREKRRERGELGPEKPVYKGSAPPNRFNLRPGYRWDGVDRSNGYEKKYFDHQSKRKAQEEDAYKWSTEDL